MAKKRKKSSPLKGRKHKIRGKVKSHTRRVKGIPGTTVSSLKSQLNKKLKEQLDKAVVRKFHATKKTQKKKIQRQITSIKAEIRKIY